MRITIRITIKFYSSVASQTTQFTIPQKILSKIHLSTTF